MNDLKRKELTLNRKFNLEHDLKKIFPLHLPDFDGNNTNFNSFRVNNTQMISSINNQNNFNDNRKKGDAKQENQVLHLIIS
jgi:hypothetical protein